MKMGSNYLDSRTWVSLLECNNWYPQMLFTFEMRFSLTPRNSGLTCMEFLPFSVKCGQVFQTEFQNFFDFKMCVVLVRDLSNISSSCAGLRSKQWVWNFYFTAFPVVFVSKWVYSIVPYECSPQQYIWLWDVIFRWMLFSKFRRFESCGLWLFEGAIRFILAFSSRALPHCCLPFHSRFLW